MLSTWGWKLPLQPEGLQQPRSTWFVWQTHVCTENGALCRSEKAAQHLKIAKCLSLVSWGSPAALRCLHTLFTCLQVCKASGGVASHAHQCLTAGIFSLQCLLQAKLPSLSFPSPELCILSEILMFLLRSSSGSLIFGPSSSDKWH